MNDLRRPLDDEEWTALGALFDQPGGPNRDAVFGLLHAVATAPSMVPPSEWLPVAMGERELDGTLTAVMLFRHYNSVNAALAAGQPMVPTPTDEQAIRDWCAGYMLGVDIDPVWAHDTPAMEPLYPIAILAEHDPLAGGEPVESEDWLAQAREDLGQTVVETYEALRPARQSQVMPVPRPARRGPKIGRNAPCPCGSGKKYKKCCLRNAT